MPEVVGDLKDVRSRQHAIALGMSSAAKPQSTTNVNGREPTMTTDRLTPLSEAAREAWVYALPLIEVASTRTGTGEFGGGVDVLSHQRDSARPYLAGRDDAEQ